MKAIFSMALTYFLVANPIGNSPAILALLKHFSFERQIKIMFRESIISLLIALFFQYFGEAFLETLHISGPALTLTGGLVLFNTALHMIFQKPENEEAADNRQEPFIVPIATPLISGAGLMTMIMVTAATEQNHFYVTCAILLAWVGVTTVLVTAPYLQKILGKRGMAALEQVMAMLLGLMSMDMIIKGTSLFLKTL